MNMSDFGSIRPGSVKLTNATVGATLGSINPVAAKHNPESVFPSPLDIVGEVMLTRGEKIATLERWRASTLQQIAAADDGMRTRGVSDKLAGILSDIARAIESLQQPQQAPA
jgi:hypothetical protein